MKPNIMHSSNLCNDLNEVSNTNAQGDERSLQFALELSQLRLLGSCDDDCSASSYDDVAKGKKSQNMTECVPVPSSEHVAEIVGRQGCKIKALRAKTNTYIKTPVRGEEPVFVVTGRKEDVAMARREVQSAAEHFTQIRASRNRHGLLNGQGLGVDGESAAGTITLQVRVPLRVVGLVVGPKGATIKRIQQQTHTYIVTPSRDREPVFEVTGLPENVEKAKEEIEVHIASRTGGQQTNVDEDFKNNGTEVGSPSITGNGYSRKTPTPISSVFKSQSNIYQSGNSMLRSQAPSFYPSGFRASAQEFLSNMMRQQPKLQYLSDPVTPTSVSGYTTGNSEESAKTPQWGSAFNSPELAQFPYRPSSKFSSGSSSAGSSLHPSRNSPTFSEQDFSVLPSRNLHLPVRRVGSDSNDSTGMPAMEPIASSRPIDLSTFGTLLPTQSGVTSFNVESGYSSGGTSDSLSSGSPVETAFPQLLPNSLMPHKQTHDPSLQQRCLICKEGSVVAALVPCGHNLFCFSCADGVASTAGSVCPCCQQPVTMAIVIKGNN